MSSVPRNPSPRWPFWLLIAAWVCANSPQAATYAVLTWMAEARSFSHQQQLSREVAFLLVGQNAPVEVATTPAPAPANPLPPVPADAVLKKIQLSVEHTAEVLPPALRGNRPESMARACPDSFRAPPPHEPPRVNVG